MSGVKKHCSILNYIRSADKELYELIQDLCIGRILVPRKGSPGITFLRPDKSLLGDIQTMASSDKPEDAVEAIQALLLLDHLPSVSDFNDYHTGEKDIPTFNRKKFPIVSVDEKHDKITLKGGGVITPDKDFFSRADRSNIAVYVLSGALLPTDSENAVSTGAIAKKTKKGGADLLDTREQLFESVLAATCDESKREPAMELLVALHTWASRNDTDLAELIASQVSYDALASLAIILQPYKKTSAYYVTEDNLSKFKAAVYGTNADDIKEIKKAPVFSFNAEAKRDYERLVNAQHTSAGTITKKIEDLSSLVAKTTIVQSLTKFYSSASSIAGLPAMRCNASHNQLFAEAELRVMSAVIFDNSAQEPSKNELLSLYKNCNLDRPYMCDDKKLMSETNVGFWYSTVYLIARSNALLYVPGIVGSTISDIATGDNLINVDFIMKDARQNKRDGSSSAIKSLLSRFSDPM